MSRKKKFCLIALMFITIFVISSISSILNNDIYHKETYKESLSPSTNLEGASDIIITKINRKIDINGYGLVNIQDELTIKNEYNNPISSILIGLPSNLSDDLIFHKATGSGSNSLLVEKTDIIMDGDKSMIVIYFESPLLPKESTQINYTHSYKDLLLYQPSGASQAISFNGFVFPLLPYEATGKIISRINLPEASGSIEFDNWGKRNDNFITFNMENLPQTYAEPFLANLGENKTIEISLLHDTFTKLIIEELTREITISPWGFIKVKEEILMKNFGSITVSQFSFRVPKGAINGRVFDYLGDIGTPVVVNLPNNTIYKQIEVNLQNTNRLSITSNSSFKFTLTYQLNLENYVSIDWFKQSIILDLLITQFDFLIKDKTTKIYIDGCSSINQVSKIPSSFDETLTAKVLIYESEYVSTIESREVLLTYSIDFFKMFTRPIILILIIAGIFSAIVILIKKRKDIGILPMIEKEQLPIKEIREFCSLYEQKNVLTLEIRQAEGELKRRKLTKKQYRNLVDKNESKIKEIDEEIKPFKKELMETSQTFESIIKKLDVLEAERQTVDDGLKLLESRYKKGKLPSRSAYVKLTNDFLKRRKKIDRTINRFIQQLKSYLL